MVFKGGYPIPKRLERSAAMRLASTWLASDNSLRALTKRAPH
jgi:hypothetical protein